MSERANLSDGCDHPLPILYSFRRCPYAIRTRMVIARAGPKVELRDILLKDKPAHMIAASPKATVPVMITSEDTVLEESLDIMQWALGQADPDNWLPADKRRQILALIDECDGPFKHNLDRYKYHVRHPEHPREYYRENAAAFLQNLEDRLSSSRYLIDENPSLADIALFPFIRQFANSDRTWFDGAPYPAVQAWLKGWCDSPLFSQIMKKGDIWKAGTAGPDFGGDI